MSNASAPNPAEATVRRYQWEKMCHKIVLAKNSALLHRSLDQASRELESAGFRQDRILTEAGPAGIKVSGNFILCNSAVASSTAHNFFFFHF